MTLTCFLSDHRPDARVAPCCRYLQGHLLPQVLQRRRGKLRFSHLSFPSVAHYIIVPTRTRVTPTLTHKLRAPPCKNNAVLSPAAALHDRVHAETRPPAKDGLHMLQKRPAMSYALLLHFMTCDSRHSAPCLLLCSACSFAGLHGDLRKYSMPSGRATIHVDCGAKYMLDMIACRLGCRQPGRSVSYLY